MPSHEKAWTVSKGQRHQMAQQNTQEGDLVSGVWVLLNELKIVVFLLLNSLLRATTTKLKQLFTQKIVM